MILRARRNDVIPNAAIKAMNKVERIRWGKPFGS